MSFPPNVTLKSSGSSSRVDSSGSSSQTAPNAAEQTSKNIATSFHPQPFQNLSNGILPPASYVAAPLREPRQLANHFEGEALSENQRAAMQTAKENINDAENNTYILLETTSKNWQAELVKKIEQNPQILAENSTFILFKDSLIALSGAEVKHLIQGIKNPGSIDSRSKKVFDPNDAVEEHFIEFLDLTEIVSKTTVLRFQRALSTDNETTEMEGLNFDLPTISLPIFNSDEFYTLLKSTKADDVGLLPPPKIYGQNKEVTDVAIPILGVNTIPAVPSVSSQENAEILLNFYLGQLKDLFKAECEGKTQKFLNEIKFQASIPKSFIEAAQSYIEKYYEQLLFLDNEDIVVHIIEAEFVIYSSPFHERFMNKISQHLQGNTLFNWSKFVGTALNFIERKRFKDSENDELMNAIMQNYALYLKTTTKKSTFHFPELNFSEVLIPAEANAASSIESIKMDGRKDKENWIMERLSKDKKANFKRLILRLETSDLSSICEDISAFSSFASPEESRATLYLSEYLITVCRFISEQFILNYGMTTNVSSLAVELLQISPDLACHFFNSLNPHTTPVHFTLMHEALLNRYPTIFEIHSQLDRQARGIAVYFLNPNDPNAETELLDWMCNYITASPTDMATIQYLVWRLPAKNAHLKSKVLQTAAQQFIKLELFAQAKMLANVIQPSEIKDPLLSQIEEKIERKLAAQNQSVLPVKRKSPSGSEQDDIESSHKKTKGGT